MSPGEQERYLDRRAVLIENDLVRYYMKNVNSGPKTRKPQKSEQSRSKSRHRSASGSLQGPSEESDSEDTQHQASIPQTNAKLSLPVKGDQRFVK